MLNPFTCSGLFGLFVQEIDLSVAVDNDFICIKSVLQTDVTNDLLFFFSRIAD